MGDEAEEGGSKVGNDSLPFFLVFPLDALHPFRVLRFKFGDTDAELFEFFRCYRMDANKMAVDFDNLIHSSPFWTRLKKAGAAGIEPACRCFPRLYFPASRTDLLFFCAKQSAPPWVLDSYGLRGRRGLSPVPGTGVEHSGRRGSGVDRIASWVQTLNPDVVRGVKG